MGRKNAGDSQFSFKVAASCTADYMLKYCSSSGMQHYVAMHELSDSVAERQKGLAGL